MKAPVKTDKTEAKLRDLVETAGFQLILAPDRSAVIATTGKKPRTVGYVVMSGSGFAATFPSVRRKATKATELVDALEKIGATS